MNSEVKFPPLRSRDDFLLAPARFKIPDFTDRDKWSTRVYSNLLYYQTNYFAMTSGFLLVGFIRPKEMLCGIISMSAVFGLFCCITNSRSARKFKRDHPVISLIVIFSGAHFVVYKISSMRAFQVGIMLPVVLTFMHASLRKRNLRNRVMNRLEAIGLWRTPMGLFLEALGQELAAIF